MKQVVVGILALLSLLGISYATIFWVVRSGIEEPELEFSWHPALSWLHVDTDNVSLEEGVVYGWASHFRSTREPVVWNEFLTMPSAPKTWETSPLIETGSPGLEPVKMTVAKKVGRSPQLKSISEDRKTAHSSGVAVRESRPGTFLERICFVKHYTAYHTWTVLEGDPAGEYVFRVTLDGKETTKVLRLKPVTPVPALPFNIPLPFERPTGQP